MIGRSTARTWRDVTRAFHWPPEEPYTEAEAFDSSATSWVMYS